MNPKPGKAEKQIINREISLAALLKIHNINDFLSTGTSCTILIVLVSPLVKKRHLTMKKTVVLMASLLAGLSLFAQSYKITWGEEIKLKKGTSDLDIVAADNTGLYFTEERAKARSIISIGGGLTSAYKLYKVDKNFGEVFDKEYKKELKGLDFNSFQTLGNDLYIFATDYIKRDRLFKVYGARIDKTTGELAGTFAELGGYEQESKRDLFDMRMTPIQNGNAFLMVSNISNKDRVSLGVNVLDKNLKRKESAIIELSFAPGFYSLQDVKITSDNKIVLLGKEFEETQIGKKKKKRLVFKNYVMSVYDVNGKKEKDISMQSGDRFVINGKLVDQAGGGLLLAGFYSNTSRKDDLSGFFINKVNVSEGTLAVSSYKEISANMLGKGFVDDGDDDDESKEEKKQAKKAKDDDDEDELPNEFIIRNVEINPADNSIIITSEVSQYAHYSYTNSTYNSSTRTWNYTTTHVHRFTNKDILVINADKDGNIKWLNAVPKSQREEVRTSNSSTGGWGGGFYYSADNSSYFANAGGMPYYSSFTSLLKNNTLVLLLNDHTSNNVNAEYGDKVKTVYNFRKRSNAYAVTIDLSTGKMARKFIASNNDETILMPRHAYIVKDELFLPSWRLRTLAKTQLKFAKISVK
jgi:hypothetical protein